MFSYCSATPINIKIAIGNFLSHEWSWVDEEGNFVTVEQVNQWDRYQMAIEYFEWRNQSRLSEIGGAKNKEKFLKEVATKIDEFIPARFFVKYHQHNPSTYGTTDGTVLRTYFKGIDKHEETKGLISHFEESTPRPSNQFRPATATAKQVKYLKHLASEAGFEIIADLDSVSVQKATELISFLLGDGEEPEDLFEHLQYV